MNRIVSCLVLVGAISLVGCSGDTGPARARLTGDVKYDGQPIPYGDILFTPDASKGATGPQGKAIIRNGKYDTATTEGKGIGGGPMVIRVSGFAEPEGRKLICEVEIKGDLPANGGTYDINVPKQSAPPPTQAKKVPEI